MATFSTRELVNAMRYGARRPPAIAAALLLGGLLTTVWGVHSYASGVSVAEPETNEAGEHLVRRCKPGSKQELCYWAKAGSHHDAER